MKMFKLAITATLLTWAGAASAQSISANYPESVVSALNAQGHAPELTVDSGGDPMINAVADGIYYSVLFYGCTNNTNCQDIQFRGTFTDTVLSDRDIVGQNRDWFIGKAFLDGTNLAIIEHPVVGVDGMPRAMFNRTLDKWVTALKR